MFRIALCLLLLAPSLPAQTGISIDLVSAVSHVQPGQPFQVGVFIHHEPGYHTYWRLPGIVGVPTSIAWDLPKGFSATPLQYPAPERTLMFQIKAQGYERDILLWATVTPPTSIKSGESITLRGKAAWMACAQSCHPGFKDLSLTLPVDSSAPRANPKWAPVFIKEQATIPQPSDAWIATATEHDKKLVLTLSPASPEARPISNPSKIIVFTEDGWIDTDGEQRITSLPGGAIEVTLDCDSEAYMAKRRPEKALCIVQNDSGWLKNGSLKSLSVTPVIKR
jgi:DsbC/DsbD-like thiol-disulfide interchange protein